MATAIIQARMGSTRLPDKVLADIVGKPMLARILERVSAARSVDAVVVATTNLSEDDRLADYVRTTPFALYRGSALDVLDRYYQAAKMHRAAIVVRVTADDPLKDPGIIDQAVSLLEGRTDLDYCSNTLAPTYPEGLDIEVFRFAALERAHAEASLPSDREHVTPYLYKHPEFFKLHNFRHHHDLSDWRWTVDRPHDLDFMRAVFTHFHDQPLVSYVDVIDWLSKNPDVRAINAGIVRNEGYLMSLAAERKVSK
jgi:spore coat polysaccharide biosynthesis protein SpsF